ncbi:phosphoadenosine phosphosulfate reductase (plasmid) [Streptomyces sp. NBC_01527]|uniref:phosphoadenosine phosphosulfate reductase n=1 Tax=Streptomyces sp. NBC_01527 TaxID=2903894 RepID=UPI002F90FA9F
MTADSCKRDAPPALLGATVTDGPTPDLTQYDVVTINLSGGKDSWITACLAMEAARAAGVSERVYTFHATLGCLDWPAVQIGGQTYPSVSTLAALQSSTSGVPTTRHLERTKTTLDDEPVTYDLLTYIAAYGRFPRKGTRFCTKGFKEQVEEAAMTPVINELKVPLGLAASPTAIKLVRPIRRLKVLGLRSDESRDRAARPAYRNISTNSVRHTDEWCPAKDWSTPEVREFHKATGFPHHWTYDSTPGAGDWEGTSRCSCSYCVLGSKRDLIIAARRRLRLARLIALAEAVRGDTFQANRSMHDLIEMAQAKGGPTPGIVIDDETPEFEAMERSVRSALSRPPRKEIERATLKWPRLPLLTEGPAACSGGC